MLIQHFVQVLETDMSQWDQKVSDLAELGKEMAHEGHFDADSILSASRSCQEKWVCHVLVNGENYITV